MKLPPKSGPSHRGRGYSRRYHEERNRTGRPGHHRRPHGRNVWDPYWHPWYGYTWYGPGTWWNPYRSGWYFPSYYYRCHHRWFRFGFGFCNYWRWCPYVSWYYPGCYYDSYAYYPYYTYCLGYPYNRYVYVGSGPVGDYTVVYNYYNDNPVEDEVGPGSAEAPAVAADAAPGAVGSLPEAAPPAPARVLSGAEYFLRLGDDAFVVAEYARAADAYRQAVESDPESAVARFALAEALIASGEYHQAAFRIREGLKLDPGWVKSDLDRRSLFPTTAAFRTVQSALDRYVAEHPFDATARFVHGYTHYFAGARDQARTSFEEVLRLQPDHSDAARFLKALEGEKEPGAEPEEKPRGELVRAEGESAPSGS